MRLGWSSDRIAVAAAVLSTTLLLLISAPGGVEAQARTTAQRQQTPAAPAATFPPTSFTGLKYRSIGPQAEGGAIAVAGSSQRPNEYFAGAAGGGLWKTMDAGATWDPVTDGQIRSSSVGSVAVAPSNPDTVYLGTGDWDSENGSSGYGVYRSVDAGKAWTHVGLEGTRAISRLVIHPSDAATLFAAAVGSPHEGHRERGIFRSFDAGKTWQLILSLGDSIGGYDVALSTRNPQLVFAAFWDPNPRSPQQHGSRLFRSTDGGDSWSDITASAGEARTTRGRISVSVSPVDSLLVYVAIETEGSIRVLTSVDGGQSFAGSGGNRQLTSGSALRVEADPRKINRVYLVNGAVWVSDDRGSTFTQSFASAREVRDLWKASDSLGRAVAAATNGAAISRDGGASSSPAPLPTLRLTGIAQAAGAPMLACASVLKGERFCLRLDGTADTSFDPITSAGGSLRYSTADTLVQYRTINGERLIALARSQFDSLVNWAATGDGGIHLTRDGGANWRSVGPQNPTPGTTFTSLHTSPHDPGTLYAAARRTTVGDPAPYAWKTTDFGATWSRIDDGIPDDDAIRTLVEDSMRKGLLWAGTERGVYISFNQGGKWQDLTLGMPEVPVTGIAMAARAVVLTTDGRGLWMLDDATPVRSLTQDIAKAPVHLFDPGDAQWAPKPVEVRYHLGRPADSVVVDVRDSDDLLVAHFASYRKDSAVVAPAGSPTRTLGLNSFTWNGRFPAPASPSDSVKPPAGPAAAPGVYTIRLAANGSVDSTTISVTDSSRTRDEAKLRLQLGLRLRDQLDTVAAAVRQIETVRASVDERMSRTSDRTAVRFGERVKQGLDTLLVTLIGTAAREPDGLYGEVAAAMTFLERTPDLGTAPRQVATFEGRVKSQTRGIDRVVASVLTPFNQRLAALGMERIAVPARRLP